MLLPIARRRRDGAPEFGEGSVFAVSRKIAREEAALAGRRVALRAAGFTEKECGAAAWVAGHLLRAGVALQGAKIQHHGTNLCIAEGRERRHPGARNTIANRPFQLILTHLRSV
jgi:hypothetical protein